MDNTLPFDFGFLKIDWEAEGYAGGSQLVETLRRGFAGERLHTFQLDHQHVLSEDIGKVPSHRVAL